MKIYFVAAEAFPYVKTGGLADTVNDWDELSKFKLDTGKGFYFEDHTGQELYGCVSRV